MRIAVVGAGGVGGYFGGRLAAAGNNVSFLARGQHVTVLQRDGLTIHGPAGEVLTTPVRVTSDAERIGVVDCVLVCVKTWQLADAISLMRPLVTTETAIVTLQNGVEAPRQVAQAYGQDHVLPGVAKIFANLSSPGQVRHVGGPASLTFAEWHNDETARVTGLRRCLTGAGVTAVTPDDIWVDLWTKFLFVVPMGGLGAVLNQSIGGLRSRSGTRRLLESCMGEIQRVAEASDVKLPDDVVSTTMDFVDQQPVEGISSLHHDFMARKPTELEAWNGAVVRLGASAGVATPINEVVYEALSLRAESITQGRP